MIERVPTRKVVALGMVVLMLVAGFGVFVVFETQNVKGDAPFATSVQINDDIGSEAQISPDIAIGPTGMEYAVWEDNRNITDSDIFFSNSSDNGQTWSPNIKVNSGPENQTNPSIASSPTDVLYVVWQDKRTDNGDIYISNSTDGGLTWSPIDVKINDDIGITRQQKPDVTVDTSGTVHVVWEDKRNGDYDVYYSNSNDGGSTWSPNVKVSSGIASQNQWHPSIAVDISGDIYVIWEDERDPLDTDIYFANSTNGGSSFSDPDIKVNDGTGSGQLYPSLAIDPAGLLYAVWEDYRNINPDIYFSRSQDGGAIWSTDVRVNDNAFASEIQTFPHVSAWTGSITVVWVDNREGDADVFFTNSTNGGVSWSDPNVRVNDDLAGNVQGNPKVTINPFLQTVIVVYEDDRFGDIDILTSTFTTSGPSLPTVDRFFISRTDDGSTGWVADGSYLINDQDVFYAVGWNDTLNISVRLEPVIWEVMGPIPIGTVSPDAGTDTQFNATAEGIGSIKATSLSFGINETGPLSVTGGAQIDRIFISLSPKGISKWIGDQFYTVSDTQTFYAVGWNDSNNKFVDLVDVTWSSTNDLVGDVTTPGNSTTFTANGDGICTVTATHVPLGTNDTGKLTVTSYNIDRILVSLSPIGDSDWVDDQTYPVGNTATFYACAWNDTTDVFVKLVDASWSSNDPSIGNVDPQGTSTTFTAFVSGNCRVTATNASHGSNVSGIITVIELEIDEILISPSPDGTGGWVDEGSYDIEETDVFYATAWNTTYSEFMGLVDATWVISDGTVATIDTSGLWINFTALQVAADSTCFVTASYSALQNVTGTLDILAPGIDYILIRDAADGLGNALDTATFDVDDTAVYYAAGYNDLVGYLEDVPGATWSVTNSIGAFNPATGNSTTFTATDPGVGKITVSYLGITNESGNITVNDIEDLPPAQPSTPVLEVMGTDKVDITWTANSESDIKDYVIQRADSAEGPWINVTTIREDTTSYSDSGLSADTTYYYRIVAIDTAGNPSTPSSAVSVTTEKEGGENGDDGFPWIIIILLIVIILVVVFLLFFMMKKKGTSGGGEAEI